MELWYLASWIGQLVVELGWSILQTYCMMVWKYTMLLYLYIIWDKFSLVVTTCSNGANPAQNVNGFTKTCTVASDCGEPATCENQICCPAPIQEGKILDKWRWFNGILEHNQMKLSFSSVKSLVTHHYDLQNFVQTKACLWWRMANPKLVWAFCSRSVAALETIPVKGQETPNTAVPPGWITMVIKSLFNIYLQNDNCRLRAYGLNIYKYLNRILCSQL